MEGRTCVDFQSAVSPQSLNPGYATVDRSWFIGSELSHCQMTHLLPAMVQSPRMSARDQRDFNSEVVRKHNEYRKQHGKVSCSIVISTCLSHHANWTRCIITRP